MNVKKSYLVGDDWPNSQTPYWILWRNGEISPAGILSEALYWNQEWMSGQGRFYPIHWIESRFIFSYVRDLDSYKLLQTMLLFLSGIAFVFFIYVLTKNINISATTLVLLSVTVQFRSSFDPHISFAMMLPSILIKSFVALSLFMFALGAKSRWRRLTYSTLSTVLYALALMTYEYAFFIFPVFLLSTVYFVYTTKEQTSFTFALTDAIKTKALQSISLTLLLYVSFVFLFLRPRASAISGAYVLGLSLDSLIVFLIHTVSALPFVNLDFYAGLTYLKTWQWLGIFSLTYLVFRSIFVVRSRDGNIKVRRSFESLFEKSQQRMLAAISLILWLGPPAMLGMQRYWWRLSSIDTTYLGVMIQEFGLALLLATLINVYIGTIGRKPIIGRSK